MSESPQASKNTDKTKSDSTDISEAPEDSDSASEAGASSVSDTGRSSHASSLQPTVATAIKSKKADINTFQREEDLTPMSEEECLLANPFVKGMDIKSKEWSEQP